MRLSKHETEIEPKIEYPYTLTLELTHRCPLHCLYCSNPLELVNRNNELPPEIWLSVIEQAAKLGIVECNLSGGEPLSYSGLDSVIAKARSKDIFTNLITSGVGLTDRRVAQLVSCGLESIQMSLQSATVETSQIIAGTDLHATKLEALALAKESNLPVTLNVVLSKHNLDQVGEIIELANTFGIRRLELANAQYYGFALSNIHDLMPTVEQMKRALEVYEEKKLQLGKIMQISWVIADYLEASPKACMGGWARQHIIITPDGTALPCHAAQSIDTLSFPNIGQHSLEYIWKESPAFNFFRGNQWMQEPCRSCDKRELDYGGCRCQAFLITGDASQADPVCSLSPHHHMVQSSLNVSIPTQERRYRGRVNT